jgi:hypothetical protein
MDPSSSRGSSIDRQTDQGSYSGMTHRETPKEESILNNINNDRRSQQDLMINSQGPQKINDLTIPSK